MKLIDHEKGIRIRLDLREGWERVEDANEAQNKLINGDKGPFWWYDTTKKHLITLKSGKLATYKTDDIILLLPNTASKRLGAIKKTAADLNIILRLNYKNKVQNREEAEERYQNGEKEVFWLITPDKKTIATLDFSKDTKPIIAEYPRNKTSVRYQAIAIKKSNREL